MPSAEGHDIIVVGASSGGVEALSRLAAQLPGNLPAAVFVVLHISPDSPSMLGPILNRAGPLPAAVAVDGEPIRQSRIYVARPDHHLLVHERTVRVVRGPKENRSRPSIDPLFRSAAAAYGSRVIGVVLSGYLDDGTAGLMAVKRAGGIAVVQEPMDTLYSQMPQSAIDNVPVDHIVPLAEMGLLLDRLVRQPTDDAQVPQDVPLEAKIAERIMSDPAANDKLGRPSRFSCPECGGTLWNLYNDCLNRYRCHLGHAYTAQSLLADQHEATERAVWAALRLMEERSHILTSMADDEAKAGRTSVAHSYRLRAGEWHDHGSRLRELLTRGHADKGEASATTRHLPSSGSSPPPPRSP